MSIFHKQQNSLERFLLCDGIAISDHLLHKAQVFGKFRTLLIQGGKQLDALFIPSNARFPLLKNKENSLIIANSVTGKISTIQFLAVERTHLVLDLFISRKLDPLVLVPHFFVNPATLPR